MVSFSAIEEFVRGYEQRNKGFPYDYCNAVCVALLREFNLPLTRGLYKGTFDEKYKAFYERRHGKLARIVGHVFSYNPETDIYIDPTARQFDRRLPHILLIPANDARIGNSKYDPAATHIIGNSFDISPQVIPEDAFADDEPYSPFKSSAN